VQGNEAEALRSWRSALDQIYYHNAYRVPAGYIPRSETEKALKDSLRNMEMQCKERVDLLEALKQSRQEKAAADASTQELNGKIHKTARTPRPSAELERNEKGFIGDGTIPAASYPDSMRLGPPLPQRPPMMTKSSSDQAVVGRRSSNSNEFSSSYASVSNSRTIAPPYSSTLIPPVKKTSRSPSPDKMRTMRHTLRSSDKAGRKPSPRASRSSGARKDNPITSKAASLAWQSVAQSGTERLGRSLDSEADRSTTTLTDSIRKGSASDPAPEWTSSSKNVRYDKTTRTLVHDDAHYPPAVPTPPDILAGHSDLAGAMGRSSGYPFPPTDPGQPGAITGSMLSATTVQDLINQDAPTPITELNHPRSRRSPPLQPPRSRDTGKLEPLSYPTYLKEYPETTAKQSKASADLPIRRKPTEVESSAPKLSRRRPVEANTSSPRHRDRHQQKDDARRTKRKDVEKRNEEDISSQSLDDETNSSGNQDSRPKRKGKQKQKESTLLLDPTTPTSDESENEERDPARAAWEEKVAHLMKNLPKGVDEGAAKQIFNEIVVKGDEVHWDDVAGLDIAKNALKEAVVYPFLRPDLFMGLREPARGMLLFGPPGTGKTMLARAVATESRSTFFSISASSLTSKYLGESEKLVRALFSLAKALAPSIIFVDEIDSLLSSRSGSGEHEATRRIKTEFLIQWSDLQRAAAGREQSEKEKERGDASRVLVLAATNLPWAIDEAARRRFVRRQYIPLPEDETRATQLHTLLGHQKHSLDKADIRRLVELTDGLYSYGYSRRYFY
jgi:ATP-dependent 26S proteasome regulatory subunit